MSTPTYTPHSLAERIDICACEVQATAGDRCAEQVQELAAIQGEVAALEERAAALDIALRLLSVACRTSAAPSIVLHFTERAERLLAGGTGEVQP